jgi:predicted AlkP superfamily pyrophosphatase or phosphodiesterase
MQIEKPPLRAAGVFLWLILMLLQDGSTPSPVLLNQNMNLKINARIFSLLCAALFLAVVGDKSAFAAPRVQHVFIVSFDGGKPAVMKKSAMPITMAMAQKGAFTWKAQTISPSITLTSHVSMLTGVVPARHKVYWNDWKPEKGLVKVPTVFKLAHAKGFSTALFAGKKKFRHLNLPGTLDRFEIPGYSARRVSDAAAQYIVARKPNLAFIHFADGDGAGHDFGWGSSQQIKAFAAADAALKKVRLAARQAGIENSSVFILSADHGGHNKTHGTNSPDDMTIPWIAWGTGVKPGFRITAPVNTCDTAATALWLLGVPIPANWDGKPVKSAFER